MISWPATIGGHVDTRSPRTPASQATNSLVVARDSCRGDQLDRTRRDLPVTPQLSRFGQQFEQRSEPLDPMHRRRDSVRSATAPTPRSTRARPRCRRHGSWLWRSSPPTSRRSDPPGAATARGPPNSASTNASTSMSTTASTEARNPRIGSSRPEGPRPSVWGSRAANCMSVMLRNTCSEVNRKPKKSAHNLQAGNRAASDHVRSPEPGPDLLRTCRLGGARRCPHCRSRDRLTRPARPR